MLLLNRFYYCITLLIGFGFCESKSQNLIRNGSFESYTVSTFGCAFNFSMVNEWEQINSPDHYTIFCTHVNNLGVPSNQIGIAYPVNGNAYTGAICFANNVGGREYIYQHLSVPLKADSIYCLSFFVSRADRITHAIKNIGAYFSVSQPTIISTPYISATPQIENYSGFITDTIGWTEIQGCYTALGGEEYITIGNFNSNANTDTLFVGSTNPVAFADGYGYYYIDSVSLWKNNFPTSIKEQSNEGMIKVYPNPTIGNINFVINALNDKVTYNLKIHDVVGREVKALEYDASINSTGEKEIDISDLEKGIYILFLYNNEILIGTKKIIKQ